MKLIKVLFEKYFRELFLYGMIGGGAVVIDLGLFWVLFKLGGGDDASTLYITIANIVAIAVAVVYSFTLNSMFTFKVRDNLLRRFLSFAAVSTVGIIISTVILLVMTWLGTPPTPAKIVSFPFVFIVQFTLNRLITFNTAKNKAKEDVSIETAIEEGDII